jgi:hypothetical protein
VSWCVSEGGNSVNTGHDLGGVLDKGHPNGRTVAIAPR